MQTTQEQIAQLGAVLWTDPEQGVRAVTESYAAVRLLKLADAQELERVAQSLIYRATRQGTQTFSRALAQNAHPLFRLGIAERTALIAAHLLHWSYERLSRVLEVSAEEAEALLWSARLSFCGQLALSGKRIVYPAANPPRSVRCPDSPSGRPWFQRLMDEEVHNGGERLFLQNHLVDCESCRASFLRAKDFFYALDQELAALMQVQRTQEGALTSTLLRTQAALNSAEAAMAETGLSSIRALLRKRDVQVVLLLSAVALAWRLWSA